MYDFLVDSHCHLNMLRDEKNLDIKEVLNKASKNNVKILNNIATEIKEFEKVLTLAKNFDNVYATIGVHPSETDNIPNEMLKILREYSKNEKTIGIGETGLEYFYEPIEKAKQKKSFEIHIEAARKEKLPLVIHSRNADKDMIDILTSEMNNGEFNFVLHCFSSGKELCWKGLDLGGYISISGIFTFKNAEDLRGIIKDVPLNKMILETDAPFLAPIPFRGKINEPAYIKNIAEYLSDFLEKKFIDIQTQTTKNFINLFNKVKTK